jgi:hypothetical protein
MENNEIDLSSIAAGEECGLPGFSDNPLRQSFKVNAEKSTY